jgi:hypothetical protein
MLDACWERVRIDLTEQHLSALLAEGECLTLPQIRAEAEAMLSAIHSRHQVTD